MVDHYHYYILMQYDAQLQIVSDLIDYRCMAWFQQSQQP